MRIARLQALLVDALAAGTMTTFACASEPTGSGEPAVVEYTAAPTETALASASAPASSSAAAPPASASASAAPASVAYAPPADALGACPQSNRNIVAALKPAKPVDYVELRQRFDQSAKVMMASGKPCSTAAQPGVCSEMLKGPGPKGFGSACHPAHCDFHVAVTDATGTHFITTAKELTDFLGPIDTPEEALLVAFADDHWVLACDAKLPKKVGKGWQVTNREMIVDCPIETADVTLSITEAGAVTVLSKTNKKKSGACVGRRPAGLRAATTTYGEPIGRYLASCAHLEAASVPAFERLGAELHRLEAPRPLVEACSRAAADERRHARSMNGLARRYGATVPAVVVDPQRCRSAAAMALENASEGCVRETFGALVGLHQAQNARSARVRRTMAAIARDEVRHAALAWRVSAWLEPRLTEAERTRVYAARKRAVGALRREASVEAHATLRSELGLPDAQSTNRMLDRLEVSLWGG